MKMSPDKKISIGSIVILSPEIIPVLVIRHGRDAIGTYTMVQFPEGNQEKIHRSALKTTKEMMK